jgi:hypothetical protein
MASIGFEEGSNGEAFTNRGDPVDVSSIYITDQGNYRLWAYVYRCHLNEDNDGAPNAYGLDNPANIFAPGPHVQSNLHPLEQHTNQQGVLVNDLANAASPFQNLFQNNSFHWVGLFAMTQAAAQAAGQVVDTRPELRAGNPDPNDGIVDKFPVVQRPGSPTAGFYVSTTAVPADPRRQEWDPKRYWDASTIPYAVLSPGWASKRPTPVVLGDFGLAIRNDTGATSGFFFADTGDASKVGESARKLVRSLSPNGFNEDFVTFLVFPGSGHGRPQVGQTDTLIDAAVRGKMMLINNTTNKLDLPLFLGGLESDMSRYVDYVNSVDRTDRPKTKAAQQRAETLQVNAAVGTLRVSAALRHWGYTPPYVSPGRIPVP